MTGVEDYTLVLGHNGNLGLLWIAPQNALMRPASKRESSTKARPSQVSTWLNEYIADGWGLPTDSGVDMLHDWAKFGSVNSYEEDVRRKHMLQIGVDFESSSIGLAPDGRVVHLWRNFPGAWDEEDDGPLPVTVLAPDFQSFLSGLEDRDGTAGDILTFGMSQ